jgi:hypothetical protein
VKPTIETNEAMRESAETIASFLFDMVDQKHFHLVMIRLAELCEHKMNDSRSRGDYKAASFWGDHANLASISAEMSQKYFSNFHWKVQEFDI